MKDTDELQHMTSDGSSGANFAALEQRVTGLETGVSKIQASIDLMANNLAVNSKPPWNTILTAGGLCLAAMSTIGWLAYAPVKETQADLKASIHSMVPRVELERIWMGFERRDDYLARRVEKLEDKLDRQGK